MAGDCSAGAPPGILNDRLLGLPVRTEQVTERCQVIGIVCADGDRAAAVATGDEKAAAAGDADAVCQRVAGFIDHMSPVARAALPEVGDHLRYDRNEILGCLP